MAEIFYKIQIETIFLTQTGLTGGRKCKLEVAGIDRLTADYIRTVLPSADGTPVVQTFADLRGKPIDISISALPKAVGNSLITLFNNSMRDGTTLTVTGTEAETPDFSAECQFLAFGFRTFSKNAWNDAVIKLITV